MNLLNIYNHKRTLYLFCRDNKGQLQIKENKEFFPYFYEIDGEGNCKSYDGVSLRKIFVSEPKAVPQQRTDNAWEADILFTKRYMIDKIETLDKCPIKYCFLDIEILCNELPNVQEAKQLISCISVYNSFSKIIETFYLKHYENEYKMINKFIEYMKKEQFDLWLSWNVKFDYNYLYNRIPDFAVKISPIGKSRYGDGEIYYPAGISIVDYLGWFKKVTLNRAKSYALDNIAQEYLKEKSYGKIPFGELNPKIKEKNRNDVLRMVKLEEKFKLISYFDEIRRLSKVEWEDMNWNSRVLDTLLLQEAKNQNVVLPMKPDERRGTLLDKEEFKGAFREVFKTGAFKKGVGKYDLSSCYPSMIIDFNLDPANLRLQKETNTTQIGDNYFIQNPNTLLPTVVKKLIVLKNKIKSELGKIELNSPEYKDMKIKYDAIKTIANSSFGVFGNRFFRLYNKNVASSITYLVRDLLKYVIEKLKEQNYEVIYADTDGLMINNNTKDISELLNNLVKQWVKEKYNKENITTEFSYEGYYEKLFIATLCRYKGWLCTDKGLEIETKGLESKRKDSTTWMKKFQIELIDKTFDCSREDVIKWIKLQIENIKQAPIEEIAFPCKLGRKPEDYKNVPIFLRALRNTPDFEKKVGDPFYYIYIKPTGYETEIVEKNLIQTYDKEGNEKGFKNITDKRLFTACEYKIDTIIDDNNKQEILEELTKKGLYKKEKVEVPGKSKDVMAFDEENNKHITAEMIDWDMIIQRNILMKIDVIFKAMDWDFSELILETPVKPKKREKKPKSATIPLKTPQKTTQEPQNMEFIADTIERPLKIEKPLKTTKTEEIKPFYEE